MRNLSTLLLIAGILSCSVTTGAEPLTLKHRHEVWSVVFSPDGKWIASGSGTPFKPGELKVWDASTGKETLTVKGHTDAVQGVAFSPDGKRLASVSADVKVLDTATWKEMLTRKGRQSVAFSPDGKRIAAGSLDLTVKLWDVATGKESLTLKGKSMGRSVAFSRDGKWIAAASGIPFEIRREVTVWDAATGEKSLTLKGNDDRALSLAFSPDGKRLAAACQDSTVKVWDVTTGEETLKFNTVSLVACVAFSPDGKRIAAGGAVLEKTGEVTEAVKVWDAATGRKMLTLKGHTGTKGQPATKRKAIIWSVAFSPDGKRLASAGQDKTVKVWNVAQ